MPIPIIPPTVICCWEDAAARDHGEHRLARLREPLYSAWEQVVLFMAIVTPFALFHLM